MDVFHVFPIRPHTKRRVVSSTPHLFFVQRRKLYDRLATYVTVTEPVCWTFLRIFEALRRSSLVVTIIKVPSQKQSAHCEVYTSERPTVKASDPSGRSPATFRRHS